VGDQFVAALLDRRDGRSQAYIDAEIATVLGFIAGYLLS
jgi:hypothetical protein